MEKDSGRLTGSKATPGAAKASPPIGYDPGRWEKSYRGKGVGLMDYKARVFLFWYVVLSALIVGVMSILFFWLAT